MSIQSETREKTRSNLKEPGRFRVIMHNDDFTSMEFVVGILKEVFHKPEAEAESIMLLVHKTGQAAVGIYPYDIAITRVQEARTRAKEAGYPFRMTVEEV